MIKPFPYSNGISPNWCPGCGHFSVLRSLQLALKALKLPKERVAVVSGIGCSGRISGYMDTFSFHGIHGRALPIAQGLKLANGDITVVAAGGDGDGFAIGLGHTLHAIRRNVDLTYIVLNNQVYGLTKGHTSPLSQQGFKSKSTPRGAKEMPLEPGLLALANGITFYAQGFSGQQEQLIQLIIQGIQHPGFALIQVFSPCVTYNQVNTYQWYRSHLVDLSQDPHYEPHQLEHAMKRLIAHQGLVTGLVYQNPSRQAPLPLSPKGITAPLLTKEAFHRHLDQYY